MQVRASVVDHCAYLTSMNTLRMPHALALMGLVSFSSGWLTGCETLTQRPQAWTSATPSLEGQWRYDSTRTTFYDAQARQQHTLRSAFAPAALLTVGATQWLYTGSVAKDHSYTRHGDTLLIARLGDQRLVAKNYISPERVGKILGPPDRFLLWCLTAQQLVLRDSTHTSEGSRVNYLYHSRVGQD